MTKAEIRKLQETNSVLTEKNRELAEQVSWLGEKAKSLEEDLKRLTQELADALEKKRLQKELDDNLEQLNRERELEVERRLLEEDPRLKALEAEKEKFFRDRGQLLKSSGGVRPFSEAQFKVEAEAGVNTTTWQFAEEFWAGAAAGFGGGALLGLLVWWAVRLWGG